AAAQSGADIDLVYRRGTPPVINDPVAAAFVRTAAENHCSDAVVAPVRPVMGGEDFSFYLEQRPGAFAFVGMGGPLSRHGHHTPLFDIDEEVLITGVELMVGIIHEYGWEHVGGSRGPRPSRCGCPCTSPSSSRTGASTTCARCSCASSRPTASKAGVKRCRTLM